ncbi:MAG TPA: hypothetical protein VGC03_14370 [Acidimicrobiia bacterium]
MEQAYSAARLVTDVGVDVVGVSFKADDGHGPGRFGGLTWGEAVVASPATLEAF